MKRRLSLLLALMMISSVMFVPIMAEQAVTGTGVAQGFGGPITVTVSLLGNAIQDVTIIGEKETMGIGSNAIERMPQAIKDANSIDVDIISGATYTSEAIKNAAKLALDEARGTETQQPKLTPGVYMGQGKGYGGPLKVEVELDESSIISVKVTEQSETLHIGSYAVDQIPQDIVRHQTVGSDTVTGASITSNAIKSAVSDCLIQAGADLAQFSKPVVTPRSDTAQVLNTQVAIAGTGISGLAAAVTAAKAGLDVIMIEKLSITGGCANTSLGLLMVAETIENAQFAKTTNLESIESTLARWKEYTDTSMDESNYPDYDRLELMLDRSLKTIHWLEDLGASFKPYNTIADGMPTYEVSVSGYSGKGAGQMLSMLKNTALELGVQIYTDTPAKKLITDENGKVIGIHADSKSGPVDLYADYVILATGGYAANAEMMKANMPTVKEYNSITSIGNTGDGIHMATDVGAVMIDHQWIHNSRPGYSNNLKSYSQYIIMFQHANSPFEDQYEDPYERLMVNAKGERFMNEGAPYSTQVVGMLKNDTFPYYTIFSNLNDFGASIMDEGIPSGEVFKANTIEELAEQLNMDPAILVATCARYDEVCSTGEDTDFGKPASMLNNPVGKTGPFYAIHVTPGSNDTLGGIKTTYNYEVVDAQDQVIPGLYATGAMSNSMYYNQYYFSGSQLTFGCTSGMMAAESILSKITPQE